jgi:hypothetical protein
LPLPPHFTYPETMAFQATALCVGRLVSSLQALPMLLPLTYFVNKITNPQWHYVATLNDLLMDIPASSHAARLAHAFQSSKKFSDNICLQFFFFAFTFLPSRIKFQYLMPVLCCSEVHKIWYSEELVLIILNIFQASSVFPYKWPTCPQGCYPTRYLTHSQFVYSACCIQVPLN